MLVPPAVMIFRLSGPATALGAPTSIKPHRAINWNRTFYGIYDIYEIYDICAETAPGPTIFRRIFTPRAAGNDTGTPNQLQPAARRFRLR
jgi:hypothetical protein